MNDELKRRKEEILQHLTCTAIASRYNAIKRIGSEHVTICPAHDDTKPSLTIYTGKDGKERAKCFVCGFTASNPIDLYMALTGQEFVDAIEDLSIGKLQGAAEKPVSIDAPIIRPAEWEVTQPPKDNKPNMEHFEFGQPVDYWCFKNAAGEPLFYELRYEVITEDGEIKKEPRPLTWGRNSKHMPYKWSHRAWPAPRPMYNLDQLAKYPATASVVLFEGPRKADLAQMLLKVPCMSWSGGANAWTYLDLEPLRGRKIILFPDNDEAGIGAMRMLAVKMTKDYGCNCEVVNIPAGKGDKWDICDETALTSEQLKAWLKDRKAVITEIVATETVKQSVKQPSKKIRYIHDPAKVANDATGGIGCEDSETSSLSIPETSGLNIPVSTATIIPISEKYPMPSDNKVAEDWPEPEDLLSSEVYIPINKRYLPRIIADYAMTASRPLGGDPASLAMAMLVTIGSAIDDRLKLRPDRHGKWSESARLWLMLVGSSSAKKSPAINMSTAYLKKLDKDLHKQIAEAKTKAKYLQKTYDKAMQKWADDQAQGIESPLPVAPEMPDEPRLYGMDLSIEAFGDIASRNPRGILLEYDELQTFLGSIGQYKSGGGSDRGLWLSAYNGGPMRVDRISQGRSIQIENFSCSILSGTQPKYIAEYAKSTTEDGLLQRFLPVFVPRAEDSHIVSLEESRIINSAKQRYDELLKWCVEMRDTDIKVYMEDEARQISFELFKRIQEIANSEAYGTGCSSALSKLEGGIHRIALIYHVIQCFEDHIHPTQCEVSIATMRLVEDFVENFVAPSICTFYRKTIGTGVASDLEKVAKFLLAHDKEHINASILKRNCSCMATRKISERKEILSQLCESNWIRPDPKSRTDRISGLPSGYEVNPIIRQKYAEERLREQRRLEVVREQMYREKFGWDYRKDAKSADNIENDYDNEYINNNQEQAHG